MIQRAINSGVSRFFVPAIDSNYTPKMYALEKQYPENVFLMMGLHPTYVKRNYMEELAHVERELASKKFYAVGEIGIDLFWDKTFLKEQQHAFQYQILSQDDCHTNLAIAILPCAVLVVSTEYYIHTQF
jgi:TatD DNase family protein